jgi:hypothetical protein
MSVQLYNGYFQKSKAFLYPALGFKTNKFLENTFICFDDIVINDRKIICVYKSNDIIKETVLLKELLSNDFFDKKIEINNDSLYVYNFPNKQDWNNFIKGKYSFLSEELKNKIKNFYGEKSNIYIKYLSCYLYPNDCFKEYSELLNVPVDILKEVGELCNKIDIKKETYAK